MEANLMGALPETMEENERMLELWSLHQSSFSDNPFCIDDKFDMEMPLHKPLDLDITDFDIADMSFALPPRTMTINIGTASNGVVSSGKCGGDKGVEHHDQQNVSVDMFSTVTIQGPLASARPKTMTPMQFAAITSGDPKKIKRIHTSKEKKNQQPSELEKRALELEKQSSNLFARVSQLKKETLDLASIKKELEIEIQGMRKTSEVQSVLKKTIEEQVYYLRAETTKGATSIEITHSYQEMVSQLSSQLGMNPFPHPQEHFMPPPPLFGQPFSGEFSPNFSNYNDELAPNRIMK